MKFYYVGKLWSLGFCSSNFLLIYIVLVFLLVTQILNIHQKLVKVKGSDIVPILIKDQSHMPLILSPDEIAEL